MHQTSENKTLRSNSCNNSDKNRNAHESLKQTNGWKKRRKKHMMDVEFGLECVPKETSSWPNVVNNRRASFERNDIADF